MAAPPDGSSFFLFVILPMVGLWLLLRHVFHVPSDLLTLGLTVLAMAIYFIWKAATRPGRSGDVNS